MENTGQSTSAATGQQLTPVVPATPVMPPVTPVPQVAAEPKLQQPDITNTLIWLIVLLVSAVCWIAGYWIGISGR